MLIFDLILDHNNHHYYDFLVQIYEVSDTDNSLASMVVIFKFTELSLSREYQLICHEQKMKIQLLELTCEII
jgi:hypothetical protein